MTAFDSRARGRIIRYLWCVLPCLVVLAAGGLWYWHSLQPKRVSREHADVPSEEFRYMTRRFQFGSPPGHWLSNKEAEDDLDELEWLLENRYSYLKLKGVDYRAALDTIRSALGDGISRRDLALQLMKFITLFGDGHSRVASSSVRLRSLCSHFLPFLVEESGGRLVAFKPDRSGLVDPDFPFLRALDGLPVSAWLEAAGQYVADGSPQYARYHTIRTLRYVECLRKEFGLSESASIAVELESADGSKSKQIELPLTEKGPVYGFWPRRESGVLPTNIGYLRIGPFMDRKPEFLDELIETMNRFKDTDGLVIDIRKNSGGSRDPLRVLFPFFMAENDAPRVVNVAAYRLGTRDRKEQFEARHLYPASSPHWSKAERAMVEQFAATFQPEWPLPKGEFSQWHYFAISPARGADYYHYDKPVVILMDRWNFSACDIFLGAFRGCKNVTLMGLPSGGGSGCYEDYRLANCQIRISLSSMASFQPNGELYDGNGIPPDIIVEPIPTDFIGGTDSVLDAARALLDSSQQARDIRDVLGVTHVAGKYRLTDKDFLNEGADQILALGSRVIKVWFHNLQSSYPFNSKWPDAGSLVDTAKSPHFRSLFDKPFTTYIMMSFSRGRGDAYFRHGMTEQQILDEQRQFYELTKYLLTTYQGTGKTFVLQHWEGDWLIRGNFDRNADPTPKAIRGMIDWLNARQAGVNQATQEVGRHGVRVYHAAEVNRVVSSMEAGRPGLVNEVLPHTNLDLVSYSAWDAATARFEDPNVLREALDFIAANMPDSPDFGNRNVYLGEFGMPENQYTAEQLQKAIPNAVETALDWGCPYVVYWQLYCNELKEPRARPPVQSNDAVKGFWLIRPDGSKSWVWHYFNRLLTSVRQP
jgi:C-terminal processing protease CtpA/Prc